MHGFVRYAGILLAAALVGCGDGDAEPGTRADARDTVAESPYGPGVGAPGAVAGPPDAPPSDTGAAPDGDAMTGGQDGGVQTPAQPPTAGRADGAAQDPAPSPPTPAAPVASGSEGVSTDAILRATSRTYDQVRSMQADFQQTMRNPLLGQTTRSSGVLYQRQPDRFLMQFSDPEGDLIVSDGQYFWLYYPSVDARQVIRAPRGPQGLDLHAQFIGDPVRRFEATSHGRESVRGRDAHVLTLVPREPLGYRSLKVWIDAQDHLVRRFELTEENGNVRQFELSNLVVNPSLPDRLFEFTPPAGAQIIQRG
jgi:outer membrane lipoprotein carrier protein